MNSTDYHFQLLTEGRLDMMFLPAGAVAWLWQYDRPQKQIDTASQFAKLANDLGDKITDSALLRADKNILVLRTQNGLRISIYPDGGLGANGEPVDNSPEGISAFLSGDIETEMGSVVVMPDDLDIQEPLI